jgi:hypothetical protein
MGKGKTRPFLRRLEDWMAQKSAVLSKAQALTTMGLPESAQPLWASAATYEERIASLLDAHEESLEAAVHRISAAFCYQKAGDPSRATSLYRAALAGPLKPVTRKEVEQMVAECLSLVAVAPEKPA